MITRRQRLLPLTLAGALMHCAVPVEQEPATHESVNGVDYRVVETDESVVLGSGDRTGWLAKINQQLGSEAPPSSPSAAMRVADVGPTLLRIPGTLTLEADTTVEFPAGLYLQAEQLVLEQGAVLRVAGVAKLHVARIDGPGLIDASGNDLNEAEPIEAWSSTGEVASVALGLAGPDGSDGVNGAAGDDGDDAECRFFKSDPADPGDPGADGTDGGNGGNGPVHEIFVGNASNINMTIAGGAGGNGGAGGPGGDGGDGCCKGISKKRDGKNGGNGGDGGDGGNGGDGGLLTIYYCFTANPNTINIDVSGGAGGLGGAGGAAGDGGADGSCNKSDPGVDGSDGTAGANGQPGAGGSYVLIKLDPDDPQCS